jgi:hypothetical protein
MTELSIFDPMRLTGPGAETPFKLDRRRCYLTLCPTCCRLLERWPKAQQYHCDACSSTVQVTSLEPLSQRFERLRAAGLWAEWWRWASPRPRP